MIQPEKINEIGSLSSSPDMRALPRIGQALIEDGVITVAQLHEALRRQTANSQRLLLGEVLLQMKLVDSTSMLKAVARSLNIVFVADPKLEADTTAMKLLPEAMRREHCLVPLRREQDTLVIATADPQNDHVRELAQRECGLRVIFVASPSELLDAMLSDVGTEGAVQEKAQEIVNEMLDESLNGNFTLQEKQIDEMMGGSKDDDMGPVVKLVNFAICSAVEEGASDIHIEPDDGKCAFAFVLTAC